MRCFDHDNFNDLCKEHIVKNPRNVIFILLLLESSVRKAKLTNGYLSKKFMHKIGTMTLLKQPSTHNLRKKKVTISSHDPQPPPHK